jgi:CelD/BcsL family acetyltransferase involved in cellulose biosynthesis
LKRPASAPTVEAGLFVARPAALTVAEIAAWSDLADRAAEPNPFLRPEFVLAALERRRGGDVELLVVREGDRWLACTAFRRAERWRWLPLPFLAPWLPEYTYLATPLVDRDAVAPASEALVRALARERRAAALVLDPVDATGPVAAGLIAAAAARGLAPVVSARFERAALRRRPANTYLEEAVSSRGRRKLRSRARKLRQALGPGAGVADRSADPTAPVEFLALERSGWKGEAGTALDSTPGDATFFARMCADMAAAGRLQILALEGGGRTAAMQCNLVDGDVMFAFKVAYEPALAHLSPGVALEIAAVEIFHERMTAVLADSCAAPDSALINRLWPDRRALMTLLLPTGARTARLVGPALRAEAAARRAYHRLRRAVKAGRDQTAPRSRRARSRSTTRVLIKLKSDGATRFSTSAKTRA